MMCPQFHLHENKHSGVVRDKILSQSNPLGKSDNTTGQIAEDNGWHVYMKSKQDSCEVGYKEPQR